MDLRNQGSREVTLGRTAEVPSVETDTLPFKLA